MDKEIVFEAAKQMKLKQRIIDLIVKSAEPEPELPQLPPPPPEISANCDRTVLAINAIDIMGWAVSQHGIRTIEVSINDVHIGCAVYGIERSDVQAAFPEIDNAGNAGFCLFRTLEPPLPTGIATLEIKITSNGEHVDIKRFELDVTDTYEAFLQVAVHCDRVLLDIKSVEMIGFAVSPYQIGRLDVYIDDIYLHSVVPGIQRPDAEALYPCYKGAINSGFCLYHEFEAPIEEGHHTISFKATTEIGIAESPNLAVEAIRETPSIFCDETHLATDAVEIIGFAISARKISGIEVYIDDAFVGVAPYGLSREDVARAYPSHKNAAHSGFCFYKPFDMPLQGGIHTLAIKALTQDGDSLIKLWSAQIEVDRKYEELTHQRPNIFINCDNVLLTFDVIEITGWAVSPVGTKEVDVLIDGVFIDKAVCGVEREASISERFPCCKDSANSGFCLYKTLESPLSQGQHTVTLRVRSNIGHEGALEVVCETVESYESYSRSNPTFFTSFDTLLATCEITRVMGWIVTPLGLHSVEIFVDGNCVGNAKITDRHDIAPRYPCYKDTERIFFTLEKVFETPLSHGRHSLTIRATAKDGQTMSWDFEHEYIEKYCDYLMRTDPKALIQLDRANISLDFIEVGGWALSPDGIDRVEVYLDNEFIGTAHYGFERRDMREVFPLLKAFPDGADCGFILYQKLDKELQIGYHTLKIEAVSTSGLTGAVYEYNFINKLCKDTLYHIPRVLIACDKLLPTLDFIEVEGWALSPDGIDRVEVYLDNEFIGTAHYGFTRADMKETFPLLKAFPDGADCGFILYQKLDKEIQIGYHTLKAVAVSTLGLTRAVYECNFASRLYNEYRHDVPRVNLSCDKILITLDFIEVEGWALSPDGIDKVEVYLDNGFVGTARYGFQRRDMEETYPLLRTYPNGVSCGFCLYQKLDRPLPVGYHTLKVVAVSMSGLTREIYEYNFINRPYKGYLHDVPKIILSCDKLLVTPDVIEAEGWAASPDGVRGVEVYVDDQYIDKAFHGISTQEIGKILPCYKNSSHSGFVLYNAYENSFTAGDHCVTLKIISETGLVREWSTQYYVADSYEKYLGKMQHPPLSKIKGIIEEFLYRPKISVVTPVYNVSPQWLDKCIQSVVDQYYENWELCIYDDASTHKETIECLYKWKDADSRIKISLGTVNMHISGATNEALKMAEGEFIALLDNDDELTKDALYENVKLLNSNHELDLIYSDEDKLEKDGTLCDPFFKPDWSPELFCSMMYTCHLGVYRKSIMDKINGFRKGFEGSQDYDMVLRFTQQTTPERIAHIPKALYHWRKIYGSASESSQYKTYAFKSAVKALTDYMERNSIEGEVINENDTGLYRIKRKLRGTPLVSIIIPTKDKVEYLEKCVTSLIDKTDYPNVEIIVLDTGSIEPATREFYEEIRQREIIKKIDYPNPEFNYAEANNWAAARAQGQYLLFLNNDTEVIERTWLSAMMEYGQLPEVGAVGAKLLYPDNSIQHMGVVVGLRRAASHVGRLYPDRKPMSFPFLHAKDTVRNVTAVTGACLLMRKSLFDEMEGFDVKFRIAFNDIDLCLRVRKKGYKVIYTPYAKLYHHESVSVGKPYEDTDRCAGLFEAEVNLFRERWDIENYVDPYFNINLDESLRFKH
ncbi:glycosyltransferase family 2 protein [Candidatus Magnetominusculus dajiuhuensis]|uniref:glycosyltransferase family 2 protein n=1 Tax=Candidatus Magnetominusculus dajiuhuensis TaxID=3137712 RepID=UPI003B430AF2